MIRLLVLILSVAALSACGKAQTVDVAPDFSGYVSSFEAQAAEHGSPTDIKELTVKFGKMTNSRERAFCDLTDGQPPLIVVSKEIWDKLEDSERESLMFHELGHCILGRVHRADVDSSTGVPVSLMNPYAIDAETYQDNHDAYVSELFVQRIARN